MVGLLSLKLKRSLRTNYFLSKFFCRPTFYGRERVIGRLKYLEKQLKKVKI